MKAVILAAGIASRLRPLTDTTPKCLLKIGERCLLQRAFDALLQNGFREFVIVTGYRQQQIVDFLESHYPALKITFIYNERYASTNNIYSLWLTRPYADKEDVLLLDSDILFDPQIVAKLLGYGRADALALNHHAQAPDYNTHPTALCDMACEYIMQKKPVLSAFCFDNPDHVGHGDGHDTPAYYAKLKELDGYVGRIVDAIKEAGIYENSIIIVTADHGGINKGHGGKTMEEMETPFIIAGKNIKKGGAFEESMMQFDCASTIASVFNLEQPQVWIGRPMTQVFE